MTADVKYGWRNADFLTELCKKVYSYLGEEQIDRGNCDKLLLFFD